MLLDAGVRDADLLIAATNADEVNLRKAPGTSSKQVGKVKKGDKLVILETKQYGGMREVTIGMQNETQVEILSGLTAGDGSYKMSILKTADPEGTACARFFWEYPAIPGLGHFLHTYVCDGNPVIPTFQGEPERVSIPADIDAFTEELWTNLDENNKISLFVRYTDLATREVEQRIINKHC